MAKKQQLSVNRRAAIERANRRLIDKRLIAARSPRIREEHGSWLLIDVASNDFLRGFKANELEAFLREHEALMPYEKLEDDTREPPTKSKR